MEIYDRFQSKNSTHSIAFKFVSLLNDLYFLKNANM